MGLGACEMHPDEYGGASPRPVACFGKYRQGHEDFHSDCFSLSCGRIALVDLGCVG